MNSRLALGLAAALLVVATAGIGFGEDKPDPKQQPMSEQEMWQKMAELAQPSAMHKDVLSRFVGTWNVKGKAITGMGDIPITGTSEHTWALGKRFVGVDYSGPWMGGTFEGAGYIGFDNLEKQFQQVWIMTMATNMDVMTGSWDAGTKTLTWRGSMKMPDGSVYAKRTTNRFKSEDVIFSESFATGPDGKEVKEMEMTYTRADGDDGE